MQANDLALFMSGNILTAAVLNNILVTKMFNCAVLQHCLERHLQTQCTMKPIRGSYVFAYLFRMVWVHSTNTFKHRKNKFLVLSKSDVQNWIFIQNLISMQINNLQFLTWRNDKDALNGGHWNWWIGCILHTCLHAFYLFIYYVFIM